jgi:hypothetical protein
MAHSPVRDALVALANSNGGDPTGFLEGLSEIHNDWHTENIRTYGFLLFHHRVVRYFNTIVNPALQQPIAAYTEAGLAQIGTQAFTGSLAGVDSLTELRSFSFAVESWHNTAHSQIAFATQTPLMDPRQNIFFRPFWQLHLYIEGMFQTVLEQYGNQAHSGQFLDVQSIAAHLEEAHHSWVPMI